MDRAIDRANVAPVRPPRIWELTHYRGLAYSPSHLRLRQRQHAIGHALGERAAAAGGYPERPGGSPRREKWL